MLMLKNVKYKNKKNNNYNNEIIHNVKCPSFDIACSEEADIKAA